MNLSCPFTSLTSSFILSPPQSHFCFSHTGPLWFFEQARRPPTSGSFHLPFSHLDLSSSRYMHGSLPLVFQAYSDGLRLGMSPRLPCCTLKSSPPATLPTPIPHPPLPGFIFSRPLTTLSHTIYLTYSLSPPHECKLHLSLHPQCLRWCLVPHRCWNTSLLVA